MIYNTQNIQDLNVKNYKRLFAFGCSFTNYYWPTWADVIAHDMPGAHYTNTGKAGAGNTYILAQLSQAMQYYNIGEDDLVCIMWTSFYRQDSYRKGKWNVPGNIYSQDLIPHDVVTQHLDDTVGFAQRDYAIIDTATKMLDNAPFDSVAMWGVDPTLNDHYGLSQHPEENRDWTDLLVFYKDLNNSILPDLLGVGCNGNWTETFSFKNDQHQEQPDYHPMTSTYYNYLEKVGFKLSDETKQWASECDMQTHQTQFQDDLRHLHKGFKLA
mgnify:CR=1 FL=1|jgi:hypothetical protein|tara:strand:+ start:2092 stop:2898 length:807 start_codon:yes stop_codon:yes gene_type:complete